MADSLEEGEVQQLQSAERGRLVRVAYGEDGALRTDAEEADTEAPPLQDDPSYTCQPPTCFPQHLFIAELVRLLPLPRFLCRAS